MHKCKLCHWIDGNMLEGCEGCGVMPTKLPSTRVRTLPGRTGAHAWRTALFSSATVERCVCVCLWGWGVGPKRLPCHVLYGAGHCLGRTQSYVQTPPSPMATFDSSGSGCTDACSWLHPPRPAHSSPHGGLHPIPWTGTHHYRYSVSIVCGLTLCASSPTRGGVALLQSEPRTSGWTPRPISAGQQPSPNGSKWHPPPKSADHLHKQTRSRDEAVCSDHSDQLTAFPWRGDFHPTSSDVVGQSLGSIAIFFLHPWDTPSILATPRWELSSADDLLQYLLWQILWHDPL